MWLWCHRFPLSPGVQERLVPRMTLGAQVGQGCFSHRCLLCLQWIWEGCGDAAGHGSQSPFSCQDGPARSSVGLGRVFNPAFCMGLLNVCCSFWHLISRVWSTSSCSSCWWAVNPGAVKAAASQRAQWDLTAIPGSLLMLRLRILDAIPCPGKPAALVGANHSACSPSSPR